MIGPRPLSGCGEWVNGSLKYASTVSLQDRNGTTSCDILESRKINVCAPSLNDSHFQVSLSAPKEISLEEDASRIRLELVDNRRTGRIL